ncbi:MAG: linear amide C-N hydrolase [Ignavibacteriales bacterium]|nr:linear amide C-N hydrolase [Ignavibacteriales bacterium]
MKTDAEKTKQSLKKINEFPFYIAKYYGDYKINDFRNGAIKSPNDIVPFFQSLFSKLGQPAELNFPKPPEINSGCSAFFCRDKNNSAIIGKNNDWKRDPILLLKTTPDEGYTSLSMVNLNFCDIFQLGSFDHNLLLAPYVPLDGMNEMGLVVTTLAVHEGAEYPLKSNQLSVGDFNLIRIILDTCTNIDEAIATLDMYNIMSTGPLPIHLLIADKRESCIVEFFDGKTHIKRDQDLNYLTNFLKLKTSDYDNQKNNCNRYQTLERRFESKKKIEKGGDAKKLLSEVSVYTEGFQIPSTIYSVIYRPDDLSMKIKTGDELKYYNTRLKERE